MKKVTIYTDGACSGNPGPGGWGAYLIYGEHTKELSGCESNTTNNRMEIKAAVEALNSLKEHCDVDLYTDSKYVQNGITTWIIQWQKNNWRTSDKKLVKNLDLWQNLLEAVKKHKVKWHWVKGHVGVFGNEKADKLARLACEAEKIKG